ncbi:MAG: ribosome maturation factor RimP [Acidobacteria bacterium]|nr:ribosome maturation factor RimP [Acidobacteriota bacterium]
MELETPLRSLLSNLGLELYDLELTKGTLNVTVNRAGGVDLEELTRANRAISEWLDLNDPIPGRFTLDVSSPGLERRLRTVEHFRSAVGEVVTLRERRADEPTRRLEGTLRDVTATTVMLEDQSAGEVHVRIESIERARTVFQWGGEAKPSPSRGKPSTTTSKKG